MNGKYEKLCKEISDNIINELRNSDVSASDVALESGMTEDELLNLLTLKEKDYLAYKTADTTIKKLSKTPKYEGFKKM